MTSTSPSRPNSDRARRGLPGAAGRCDTPDLVRLRPGVLRPGLSLLRRSGKPSRFIRAILRAGLLALLAAPLPLRAQDFPPGFGYSLGEEVSTIRILALDQERLFADSRFGLRVGREIETRSRALAAENRQLEAALEQEERDLTAQRPGLDPATFRARADAFDVKVQRIRNEQDAKARQLNVFREAEQQRFVQALAPVLTALVSEHQAVAILDRRLLLYAADSIDITTDAIRRVDELIGEGQTPPELSPQDQTPQDPSPDAAGAEAQPESAPQTPPADGTSDGK